MPRRRALVLALPACRRVGGVGCVRLRCRYLHVSDYAVPTNPAGSRCSVATGAAAWACGG